MSYIVVGDRKIAIPGVLGELSFHISGRCFVGIHREVVDECLKDFIKLLKDGGALSANRKVPASFNEETIKRDIVDGSAWHDKRTQSKYLKETRKYWERKYSFPELLWMNDFGFVMLEVEGKVGVEWFRLYEIIRGPLPRDYPVSVSFNILIGNVWDWKVHKYMRKTISDYFKEHYDSIEKLLHFEIPMGMPIYNEIGLTVEEFFAEAVRIRSEEGQKRMKAKVTA